MLQAEHRLTASERATDPLAITGGAVPPSESFTSTQGLRPLPPRVCPTYVAAKQNIAHTTAQITSASTVRFYQWLTPLISQLLQHGIGTETANAIIKQHDVNTIEECLTREVSQLTTNGYSDNNTLYLQLAIGQANDMNTSTPAQLLITPNEGGVVLFNISDSCDPLLRDVASLILGQCASIIPCTEDDTLFEMWSYQDWRNESYEEHIDIAPHIIDAYRAYQDDTHTPEQENLLLALYADNPDGEANPDREDISMYIEGFITYVEYANNSKMTLPKTHDFKACATLLRQQLNDHPRLAHHPDIARLHTLISLLDLAHTYEQQGVGLQSLEDVGDISLCEHFIFLHGELNANRHDMLREINERLWNYGEYGKLQVALNTPQDLRTLRYLSVCVSIADEVCQL